MTSKMVTLADAKIHLSKLTDLAAQGETVIITKHGKPVARVSRAESPRQPVDLHALRKLTTGMRPLQEDAGSFMRRLRDEARY